MTDHYKTLRIRRTATSEEVKAAFRHWAKQVHPDLNPGQEAQADFQKIKEAYEVLNDAKRRADYDAALNYTELIAKQKEEAAAAQARIEFLRQQQTAQTEKAEAAKPKPKSEPAQGPQRAAGAYGTESKKLLDFMKQARYKDAEDLARKMIKDDPRAAVAWAALGDIYRSRGDFKSASKHYVYAAQFDPDNLVYEAKHQEMEEALISRPAENKDKVMSEDNPSPLPFIAIGVMAVLLGCWVLLDRSPFPLAVGPISQWTTPLAASLLIGGVVVGVCLSAGDIVDRFFAAQGSALVKVSPAVVLAGVAVINFWVMALLYLLTGALQNSFNKSLTRVVVCCSLFVVFMSILCAVISSGLAVQTLIWGGSLVYWGALLGWVTADSLHRTGRAS